jgi:hypothetical protein
MEDLVAVALGLANGDTAYVLASGRVFDPVDPRPLARTVLDHATRFALPAEAMSASVCPSLQEASAAPYFFEGLFHFASEGIPRGRGYAGWRREKRARMEAGGELWFVGSVTHAASTIPHVVKGDGYQVPGLSHDPPSPFEQEPSLDVTPWAQDELECHGWVWSRERWIETDIGNRTSSICDDRGYHDEEVIDRSHAACLTCGLTSEIET